MNFAAGAYLKRFSPNIGYRLIWKKWAMLLTLDRPVDWLILGDSSGNQGVMPKLIEQRLGGKAVNLCTIGNMLVLDDAWMLEAYLRRFDPPKHVILVHVHDVWHREPDLAVLAQAPVSWKDWLDFKRVIRMSSRDALTIALARHAPLFSQNLSLAEVIRHPSKAFRAGDPIDSDGFMAVRQADPSQVIADAQGHAKFAGENPFVMSQTNEEALKRIISLAETRGFDVYAAQSPLYEELYRDPSFRKYFESLQHRLAAYTEENRRFHVLFAIPMLFSKEQMENANHLTDRAARLYTEELISQLALDDSLRSSTMRRR